MSNVVLFKRPVASIQVIGQLIKLGYLTRSQRRNEDVIKDALAKLASDLHRKKVIRLNNSLLGGTPQSKESPKRKAASPATPRLRHEVDKGGSTTSALAP
jgi:hypothetical protein